MPKLVENPGKWTFLSPDDLKVGENYYIRNYKSKITKDVLHNEKMTFKGTDGKFFVFQHPIAGFKSYRSRIQLIGKKFVEVQE